MLKSKVLILCTGNSCRSHMAEAILRNAAGDLMEVYSAGSNPKGVVHPMALQVIQELGLSTDGHNSEHLDLYLDKNIDTIITVCSHADNVCPDFPGLANRYHWGFEDPPHSRREGEVEIDAFRRIRDEIKVVFEAYALGYREGALKKQ